MRNNGEDGDAGAPRDRQYYLSQAYINAFGTFDEPDWDPQQGFVANRPRIIKLYDYYQALYLKRPGFISLGRVRQDGRRCRCGRRGLGGEFGRVLSDGDDGSNWEEHFS
jgi:hypothetical protein